MSLKSFACVVAMLAGLGAPAAVFAQPDDDAVPTQKVSYADLDLSSQQGAARLMQRLKSAADQVCGGEPTTWELARSRWFRGCRHDAIARAVQQLGSPLVASQFQGGKPQAEFANASEVKGGR